ncbi:MAG: type II toxin-antitoxin system YafQ family toxin [Oscillospiraceae bacterium]|nr:type II toxin-antitoxin system YafQ family toxin [Oscillospiraceae bacterium]
MNKYQIVYEKSYRKQYRLLEKRQYNMSLLDDVVNMLANGQTLPEKHRDHPLKGDRKGYRDCHIKDDWILLYKINKGVLTLILSETGTHSDILK